MRLEENDRSITSASGYLPQSIALRARIAQRDNDAARLATAVPEIDRLLEAHPGSRFGQRARPIVENCQTRIALGQIDGPAECAWLPSLMRDNRLEYSDPLEDQTTPQNRAMVDCITGRAARADDEQLTLEAQIAACDRLVEINDDPFEAILLRANTLFLHRGDRALWERAYADFSTVIRAASEGVIDEALVPHARARRAELSLRLDGDLQEALADISHALPNALDPEAEMPFGLTGDVALRVDILTALAQRTGDADFLRAALDDAEALLSIPSAQHDMFVAMDVRQMRRQNILIRACLAAIEMEAANGPGACHWLPAA